MTSYRFKQKSTFYFISLFFYASFGIQGVLAEQNITINTGTLEPLFRADGKGFYNKLVKESFSRLNLDAKVIYLTSARAMRNVNQGIDDGTMLRIKGMEKKYTNLVRVPTPILKFDFVAYSLDKNIKITDWDSLKPYSVGIIRGWKIYEKNVAGTKKLTMVTGVKQLFKLLMNGRSEIILFERNRGDWWNKDLNAKAFLLERPLAEKDMYIYLHRKHSKLVPRYAKILEDMKNDGSYQKIKTETLSLK